MQRAVVIFLSLLLVAAIIASTGHDAGNRRLTPDATADHSDRIPGTGTPTTPERAATSDLTPLLSAAAPQDGADTRAAERPGRLSVAGSRTDPVRRDGGAGRDTADVERAMSTDRSAPLATGIASSGPATVDQGLPGPGQGPPATGSADGDAEGVAPRGVSSGELSAEDVFGAGPSVTDLGLAGPSQN